MYEGQVEGFCTMVTPGLATDDLVDPNVSYPLVGFLTPSIGDCGFNRRTDRIPRDPEEPRHLLPRQVPGPEGQDSDQRETDRLLSHAPGNTLHMYPVLRAIHPPRPVVEKDVQTPQGDVLPNPLVQLVLRMPPLITQTAPELSVPLCIQMKMGSLPTISVVRTR